jgi:hypothetical protein
VSIASEDTGIRLTRDPTPLPNDVRSFFVERELASIVNIGRQLMSDPTAEIRVYCAHSEPASTKPYKTFGNPRWGVVPAIHRRHRRPPSPLAITTGRSWPAEQRIRRESVRFRMTPSLSRSGRAIVHPTRPPVGEEQDQVSSRQPGRANVHPPGTRGGEAPALSAQSGPGAGYRRSGAGGEADRERPSRPATVPLRAWVLISESACAAGHNGTSLRFHMAGGKALRRRRVSQRFLG